MFFLFFVSGFCGLLYQLIWTRMAFASFGIITPVLSVVLSVFMLGLSLGSWAGGRWIGWLVARSGIRALSFYTLAEFLIGLGAFAVPGLFRLGERVLLGTGAMDSTRYLLLSALVLAVSVLPWCILMGATFPFMMAHIRKEDAAESKSFSFLYLANVLGAMTGTLLTALVLIEFFGFRDTLRVAAAGNFMIAALALLMGRNGGGLHETAGTQPRPGMDEEQRRVEVAPPAPMAEHGSGALRGRLLQWILFWTGFAAMAMEVVWTRSFAPVLKTQVYSFAMVVAAYLGATFIGSLWYRWHLRKGAPRQTGELIGLLSLTVFLPILCNDPRLVNANSMWYADMSSGALLLASIVPFCGVLGYLTPSLVDAYSGGSPAAAGRAYALNVFGCILGPLFASYVLLPHLGDRHALILLMLPFFVFYFLCGKTALQNLRFGLAAGAVLAVSLFFSTTFEDSILQRNKEAEVRRDYAASVLSYGQGLDKLLLVNGMGMTTLTPITKFMVHLPLAFGKRPPQSALIICFGMGTSFRSALSWDLETTAVELVPSVKDAFGFYHADAAECLANPRGRIVIDDGRRYMARIRDTFDLIVVDPPPPPEAAGSSLLYSKEFCQLAGQHLKPNGILQAWVPKLSGPLPIAAARSLRESFPYVRCFVSLNRFGIHMLASREPIERRSGAELAARLPPKAAKDLMEWSSAPTPQAYLDSVLAQEIPVDWLLEQKSEIRITDDQPYNEYFILRKIGLL
jgi:spermidine synthase